MVRVRRLAVLSTLRRGTDTLFVVLDIGLVISLYRFGEK